MIKQSGKKWILYSKDGSKKLGEFDSKEAAEEREKQIKRIKAMKSKQFKQYVTDTNEDNSVNIRKVEIFKLGKHKGFNYDEEWAKKAIDNFNTEKEGDYFPSVIIGHNNGKEEKPAKGFMDNLALDGDIILSDIIKVPEETFGQLKDREYPNRSVEVNPEKFKFTALALLGGTTPHHKLPVMEFGADPDGVVINFEEEETNLKAAIETEKKLRGIRDIWWKVQEFIDKVMFDKEKTENDKKTEIKSLIDQGVELLGEEAKNFQSNKQGDKIMPETKTFTEEDIKNAKDTAYVEKFKEEFGVTPDEYRQKQKAEASEAKDARIEAFAAGLKNRNIAPAIIDDMIVPALKELPMDGNKSVQFKEDDKQTEIDVMTAFERIFDKLFELDEKGSLVVDFSEKAETSGGEAIEDIYGEKGPNAIHDKAVEIAKEKAGTDRGEKFQEEYEKAVFQLTDKK